MRRNHIRSPVPLEPLSIEQVSGIEEAYRKYHHIDSLGKDYLPNGLRLLRFVRVGHVPDGPFQWRLSNLTWWQARDECSLFWSYFRELEQIELRRTIGNKNSFYGAATPSPDFIGTIIHFYLHYFSRWREYLARKRRQIAVEMKMGERLMLDRIYTKFGGRKSRTIFGRLIMGENPVDLMNEVAREPLSVRVNIGKNNRSWKVNRDW